MNKTRAILKRFLKGMISGAITAMTGVTLVQPSIWTDFNSIINVLLIAGVFGALNGLLLAVQKWASWKN